MTCGCTLASERLLVKRDEVDAGVLVRFAASEVPMLRKHDFLAHVHPVPWAR